MPPYMRLIAASELASRNELKSRGFKPNSSSTLSWYAKLSPKMEVSAVAAALEITLCPLVYSGKGGVCKAGSQSSSI